VLTIVIIHHKPSTLCIEMVTNRNLGVITDNFSRVLVTYYFWQGYSRENEKRIKLSKRL
jgi:hypothetical protein